MKHLDNNHDSELDEILNRFESKTVSDVRDALRGRPGARTFGVDDNPKGEAREALKRSIAVWEEEAIRGALDKQSETASVGGNQVDKYSVALEAFGKLEHHEITWLLRELLLQEKLDIPRLITLHAEYLQDFKHKAQNDIRKLAEAGLTLGEQKIKSINYRGTGERKSKTQLYYALANTLLTAGYRGTKFNDELRKYVDMSIVDKDWYDDFWRLETVTDLQLKDPEADTTGIDLQLKDSDKHTEVNSKAQSKATLSSEVGGNGGLEKPHGKV
jgi:hypothetical protein